MYKISEFSKITSLTVKTLRYYDSVGILIPSYRDEKNLYRYYSEEDYQKAMSIKLLKDCGFTIAELQDVLNNYTSESDIAYYLEEKKSKIKTTIKKQEELIHKIEGFVKPVLSDSGSPCTYCVERIHLEPVTVASVRFRGSYQEIGAHIGSIYRSLKGNASGTPFSLYHDTEYKEHADIEICVPVAKISSVKNISVRRLDEVEGVAVVHRGPYSSLNRAYKVLVDYASKHHLMITVPSREVYLKGPGMVFRGNENRYQTEIIVPYL